MPTSPVASTRNPVAGTVTTTIPDYYSDLINSYSAPAQAPPQSAAQLTGEALSGTTSNVGALQRVSDIISRINQQAYLSAPGRQQQLTNIERWQRGELDPEIYAREVSQGAQLYGGAGFGVDSPAWQSAVRRALVLDRLGLQQKGAEALNAMYSGMPTTDIGKYTLTPTDMATIQDRERARQLELAALRQKGALEAAGLAQTRALTEQQLALNRQAQTLAEQKQRAELYAKYGYGTRPTSAMDKYLEDIRNNWRKYGYSGPPVIR